MEGMGSDGPVRAPTLSVIVRLWSTDGTALRLRGEIEHVRTGERRFFDTYGLLVDVIEQWRLDGANDTA
jgi:hypothetical protein